MNMFINSIAIFVSFITVLISQERYLDPVFNDYVKHENVVYGNAPDLPFIFWVESNTQDIDLDMDIYEPEGDTLDYRPAIIFLHSGAFFSGDNSADDMTLLAQESALRGYVSINANYRLGLNILSAYSGERAVYRGVQDGSAIIRYLKENADLYKIDTNKIYIWGSSAGGFIALHLAYIDDSERPESSYGNASDPDLGCIDCEGNNFDYSSRPNAVVACWSAIGDLDWIDLEDNVPAIFFHGDLDPIVPFNQGFPFTLNIALPEVSGSNLIHERLSDLGIESELHVGVDQLHEYWGTLNGNWITNPNQYWDEILVEGYQFLYSQINSSSVYGDINFDGVVNVLDVIDSVNILLSNQYEQVADLDSDGDITILDIIILVNIIII